MMKSIKAVSVLVLMFGLLISSTGYSASNDDRQIGFIIKDIERYEKQFSGQANVRKSTANRTLKLLNISRQRLDKISNQSSVLWQEADTRFNALHGSLTNFANGKPKSKPSTVVAKPPITASSSTTAKQAKVKPSVVQPASTSPSSKKLLSYQVARVKKLRRDIDSALKTIDQGGAKPFQDAAYVSKYQKLSQRFQQSYEQYAESAAEPLVVAVAQSLDKYSQFLKLGVDTAAKNKSSLGDYQVTLKNIDATMHQLKTPNDPTFPYKKAAFDSWLNNLIKVRTKAIEIYKPLPAIAKNAYLPINRGTVQSGAPYDKQDVSRLDRGLRDIVAGVDKTVKTFTQNLEANVIAIDNGLAFYNKLDPTDSSVRTNSFLAAGRADEIRSDLKEDFESITAAEHYSKRLKHKNLSVRTALLKKIQDTQQQYESNLKKAYDLSRMPKADSTDSKLIDIARKTLVVPKYEVKNSIKRLVINSKKVHRSKKTTDTEIDDVDVSLSGKVTLSGTSTTYHYEWDQFQVTTAEAVGDKFYMYHTTFKYYTSGSTTTILNKWIMGGRIQGSEILEENIDK